MLSLNNEITITQNTFMQKIGDGIKAEYARVFIRLSKLADQELCMAGVLIMRDILRRQD